MGPLPGRLLVAIPPVIPFLSQAHHDLAVLEV
jgi:hypothetical protein